MTVPAGFDPVLVTGGSGFVGACVVGELRRRGHAVHVLLRDPARAWRLTPHLAGLHVHRGDLTDAATTADVLRTVRPRVVLHLATHGAYESQADARVIFGTNVVGTYNLLEAAAHAGVALFVNTGSSSEYGFRAEPMRETDRLEPNSFYAVAKAAQTHLCGLFSRRTTMSVVTFRLFSVYGPLEEPTRLVPTLIRRARAGLPLQMVAPEIARDFVAVDDVVRALTAFPETAPLNGEVLNLGSGRQTSLREMVEEVVDLLASRSPVHWGGMAARQWDTDRWSADVSTVARLLGWSARLSLRQGLERMAQWMSLLGDDYGSRDLAAAG
jgi:nucleoside-diphosphate-sugar epimerase